MIAPPHANRCWSDLSDSRFVLQTSYSNPMLSYIYTVEGMDGLLWPARFIGFGVGMMIYAVMVNYHFNETINAKTAVSLVLSLLLIVIQVFWKTN